MYCFEPYFVSPISTLTFMLRVSYPFHSGVCTRVLSILEAQLLDFNMFPEELFSTLSSTWRSMIARCIPVCKKLKLISFSGRDVPFSKSRASVVVNLVISLVRPFLLLSLPSYQISGDSNIHILHLFLLCLFICTVADWAIILVDNHIFQNGLLLLY